MPADTTQPDRMRPAGLDDYDVDLDEIFGDITPPPGQEDEGKKRKTREDVDVDDGEQVAKRARAPRVKLDEQKLLSDEGIPRLRTRAKGLKFKGKSHEFSDAARLLSFYQLWLDDLYPKAQFLDALTMVEKTGHKTTVLNRRRDWIAEERQKELGTSIEEADLDEAAHDSRATDVAELTKEKTPAPVDMGGDEDIYTATPRRAPQPTDQVEVDSVQPDDDDLEALMMEADNDIQQGRNTTLEREPGTDEFADEEAAMAEIGGFW